MFCFYCSAGRVVGLVTCNMRKIEPGKADGIITPRLNFSVPVSLFQPILSFVNSDSGRPSYISFECY